MSERQQDFLVAVATATGAVGVAMMIGFIAWVWAAVQAGGL